MADVNTAHKPAPWWLKSEAAREGRPSHTDRDLLAALKRLMDQPTMNPLTMTIEQRKELWDAHEQARSAIAKAESRHG